MSHEHEYRSTVVQPHPTCVCGTQDPNWVAIPDTAEGAVRDALARADRLFPVNDDAALVAANAEHREGKRIRDRFVKFHLANPEIYYMLFSSAKELQKAGRDKSGIGLLYERLRWLHAVSIDGDEPFKLSNDFRAEYARLIMVLEPSLATFFRIRSLRRKL